ncbi:sulfite exporter TauE/SafE family protein, partial [Micromonospora aurantiaca (nom. illeg.)]|uniref:sulfite exporter TauE/SafE family protein n=1 Tax=Micromonospora aurantiaca (nom. illeg.) TaxID=47850 RepID=UPI00165696EC
LHDDEPDPSTGSTSRTGTAQLTRAAAPARSRTGTAAKVVIAGLLVGFLTGFLGVGGGFVIVPALVIVLDLPMPVAVGTSLLIIAINSAASLAARTGHAHFDWTIIIPFTLAAMAASLAGKKIADRLPQTVTTRAFAVLILAVAAYTAGHTLLT